MALHLVGAGHGFGRQLTPEAVDALQASAWIGALSLDPWTMRAIDRGPTRPVDLVALLAGPGVVGAGLGEEVAVLACLQAREGSASLVFAGHPLHHNRMIEPIRRAAARAEVPLNIVAGVSWLDNVTAGLGVDLVTNGLIALDARRLVAFPPQLDPTMTVVLSCLGHLAETTGGTIAALQAVRVVLAHSHEPTAMVLHVRFAASPGEHDDITDLTVNTLPDAGSHLGYTSTLVVPPRAVV